MICSLLFHSASRLARFVRWALDEEMAIASKHGGAGFVGTR